MNDAPQEGQASTPDWLTIARDSFSASTDYTDANWRKNWERNIALFQSRHPDGSKYNSAAYKHRSRLFRPKTKSVVRKNEAAAAAAFFANVDVVSVEPENDADPIQKASAEMVNELVNYRLDKTIPWYMILIGALQSAQVMGLVASYQYWKYKETVESAYEPVVDDIGQPYLNENGEQYLQEVQTQNVLEDEPCIELLPLENIRFDPGADWTNIVKSSPYVIRMVPMYVDDVKQRMKEVDPKTGQPKWKEYDDGEIRTAMVDYDTTRQQRENKRQDPLANNHAPLKEFEIVWCHENFVRINGQEYVYWTLGVMHMLTDPVPLKEAYFTGERPIVIGCCVLEANKAVPDSLVAIGSELQKEANETVNQRRDNVSLVLNKRYVVRRDRQVDIDSLLRNVAGAVTMATNPVEDVMPIEFQDVTGSSYMEQDRLNADFDSLMGDFNQGSVQTNRQLNETVGGMELAQGGANQLTEYLLRTFVETWVEPVLRQLVKLEQNYETDLTLLGLMGERAQLPQKYGINEVTDALLNHELTVRVNVGVGATNPQQKLGRFMFALEKYSQVMAMLPDADPESVRREVFALAGYKDGQRFFKKEGPPPIVQQMQAQMQEMAKKLDELQLQNAKYQLQLQDKSEQNRIAAFEADTNRMQALKPEQVEPGNPLEGAKAAAEINLKTQQAGLVEAQTIKTLEEAAVVPAMAKAKQASKTER